jgi:hypothetical protein
MLGLCSWVSNRFERFFVKKVFSCFFIENFIKNREPTYSRVISQSFFVDCNTANSGCNGGWPATAVRFARDKIQDPNQAPDKVSYPYNYPTDGSNGFPCKNITTDLIPLGITNSINPGLVTVADLQVMVANHGHVIVAIYASSNFQRYSYNIFTDATCFSGLGDVNHAVVIVGYDSVNKFFIIRNSWVRILKLLSLTFSKISLNFQGTGWGERGYMRMAFGAAGLCNIERYPSIVA